MKPSSRSIRATRAASLSAVMAAAALFLSGCTELLEQLQAEHVALATLVQTPDLENPVTNETVRGLTTFTLFFGRADLSALANGATGGNSAFTGVADAQVTLEYEDPETNQKRQLNVADNGSGRYSLDSSTAELLEYFAGATYTVTIQYSGKTHQLSVVAPERREVAEFANATKTVLDHPADQDFVVTLTSNSDAEPPVTFVSLSSVSGAASAESWTNMPKDGLGLLQLAIKPDPWKQSSFTIPAEELEPGTGYLVTASTLETGRQDSGPGLNALFTSSTFLAGTADGGGLVTAEAEE